MLKWLGAILFGFMAITLTLSLGITDGGAFLLIWWAGFAGCCLLIYRGRRNPPTEQPRRLGQQGRDIIESLKSGSFKPVKPVNAILHPGEVAFLAVPAALLEAKTVGYKSSGMTARVRVARGVSIGQYRGGSQAIKGTMRTATGEFVITQSRLVFAGDNKSFEMPITKLTNIEQYSDGFRLHQGNTSHRLAFDVPDLALAAATVLKLALDGQLTVTATEEEADPKQSRLPPPLPNQ